MLKRHYSPLTTWHLQSPEEKIKNANEGIKSSKGLIEFTEYQIKVYKEDIKKADTIVIIGLIAVLLTFTNHWSYNFGIISAVGLAIGVNWRYMSNNKIEEELKKIEDYKEQIIFYEKMIADNVE